jgi:hypothetical protein
MRKFIRHLAAGIVVALAPMAVVMVATPGVSSAQCQNGWWWNPLASQRVRATTSAMCERLVVGSGGRRVQATTGYVPYASAM